MRGAWLVGLCLLALGGLVLGDPPVVPDRIGDLGRDHLGRNAFWLVARGAAVGLTPALVAVPLLALAGAASAVGAWVGGPVRTLLGAWVTAVASVPALVWVVLCVATLGRAPWVLGLGCALAFHPRVDAVLEGQIAGWRRDEAVLAELAHGTPAATVLWRDLVRWRCGDRLIAEALRLIGVVFVIEATLAYLGMPVGSTSSLGVTIATDWGHGTGWWARVPPVALLWGIAWASLEGS